MAQEDVLTFNVVLSFVHDVLKSSLYSNILSKFNHL